MNVGLVNLEMAHYMVNRDELWQVLRTYNRGGKLLNGINLNYINK